MTLPQRNASSTPSETINGDGDTAFAQARLIADARALLGVAPHVVVGALHGVTTPYLSIQEARSIVTEFLARPV